MAQAY
jgi:hypothetical protein